MLRTRQQRLRSFSSIRRHGTGHNRASGFELEWQAMLNDTWRRVAGMCRVILITSWHMVIVPAQPGYQRFRKQVRVGS
jgi:hypothetical protein